MNLDEISYRRNHDRKKYETIDYFDTVGQRADIRNYRRKIAKNYYSYENKFIG